MISLTLGRGKIKFTVKAVNFKNYDKKRARSKVVGKQVISLGNFFVQIFYIEYYFING